MKPHIPILPYYKTQEILIRAAEQKTLSYVKAPHILFLDEHNVLIAYKRGTRHNTEPAADWEMFRYNPTTGQFQIGKLSHIWMVSPFKTENLSDSPMAILACT